MLRYPGDRTISPGVALPTDPVAGRRGGSERTVFVLPKGKNQGSKQPAAVILNEAALRKAHVRETAGAAGVPNEDRKDLLGHKQTAVTTRL